MYSDDDLLPLSGIQHFAYCKRQWALIHLEQSWEDSVDTLRGDYFHERVDTSGYAIRQGIRSERGVRVASAKLGIYGIADIVEFCETKSAQRVIPVEYKVGRPKIEDWDRLQVTAQAMCLEEMYCCEIREGALFYGQTRRRERVVISDKLRDDVMGICVRMHANRSEETIPHVSRTKKCLRCSLREACVPEVLSLDATTYWLTHDEELP